MAAAEAWTARSVAVRRARPDDAQALVRLATALGYASSAKEMRLRLQAAAGAVLIAVDDGHSAVRGFAHVQRHAGLLAPPCAHLLALVVDESARGRGIGPACWPLSNAGRWTQVCTICAWIPTSCANARTASTNATATASTSASAFSCARWTRRSVRSSRHVCAARRPRPPACLFNLHEPSRRHIGQGQVIPGVMLADIDSDARAGSAARCRAPHDRHALVQGRFAWHSAVRAGRDPIPHRGHRVNARRVDLHDRPGGRFHAAIRIPLPTQDGQCPGRFGSDDRRSHRAGCVTGTRRRALPRRQFRWAGSLLALHGAASEAALAQCARAASQRLRGHQRPHRAGRHAASDAIAEVRVDTDVAGLQAK